MLCFITDSEDVSGSGFGNVSGSGSPGNVSGSGSGSTGKSITKCVAKLVATQLMSGSSILGCVSATVVLGHITTLMAHACESYKW